MNSTEAIVEKLGPLFRSSRPKFIGLLAKPLPPIIESNIGAKFDMPFSKDQFGERASLMHAKLQLIMEHYGLSDGAIDGNLRQLAYYLLRDFVPGFQVADPNARRPSKKMRWTPYRLSFLLEEMNKLIKAKRGAHNHKSAANVLAKIEPWRTLCDATEDAGEVIRQRYSQAKRKKSDVIFTAPLLLAAEREGWLPQGTYAAALAELANDKIKAIRFL